MRVRTVLVPVLFLAAAMAGCAVKAPAPLGVTAGLDPAAVVVPKGASLVSIDGGIALLWANVPLPLRENVTVPVGTTVVRLTGQAGPTDLLGLGLRNSLTDRRRCNELTVRSWDLAQLGQNTCSGLAGVDQLPAAWSLSVGSGTAKRAGLVRLEFLTAPLDGPAAALDLSQISPIAHKLQPTQELSVPSFDGTRLYVELTLPDGPGPFPTVIWSSPYEEPSHAKGEPSAWTYFVKDWAMRGYAVVAADVRGYGHSDGCVEVWGPNEKRDQAFLVDWTAKQPWSDGNVGFYGQSYVATTPVEAAVLAPPALKAIIAVAPVINSYDDWHFGGVPNGEGLLSPVAYQAQTGGAGNAQPADLDALLRMSNGVCDPTLMARANDPRAVYDGFYEERDFGAQAGKVKAAVLYTQGFVDHNVKSQMIPDWFNGVTSPKLGLFGPWVHQHPTRADNELLMLAWLDQYVKHKPVGLEKLAPAYVVTAQGEQRAATEWPPSKAPERIFYPDLATGAWGPKAHDGTAQVLLDTYPTAAASAAPLPTQLVLAGPVGESVRLAGSAALHLRGTLTGAPNAYVAAYAYDIDPAGPAKQITFGMFNLAHRHGHKTYEPLAATETFTVDLPMLPTEWTLAAGHTIQVVLHATHDSDWDAAEPSQPGVLTLSGGADGVALRLPLAPEEYTARPLAASP